MNTPTVGIEQIETYTGAYVDPLNLDAEPPAKIRIADIAAALSKQCRYAGHCRRFYSVAEHSYLVSLVVEYALRGTRAAILGALLHDASEAYLVDVPRPIKGQLHEYRLAEHNAQQAIYRRFGVVLTAQDKQFISTADDYLLAEEAHHLMTSRGIGWRTLERPTGIPRGLATIRCLDPDRAAALFSARFADLTK